MSCNGCRVLRKGCSESCILRPCLQWIESPEAQGHATVFVAKFFGRAGLMGFINAVPENQRPALFQSLLYEACGRTVNPVHGAVGLLWAGNWNVCQSAVETVLKGGALRPLTSLPSSTMQSPASRCPTASQKSKLRIPSETAAAAHPQPEVSVSVGRCTEGFGTKRSLAETTSNGAERGTADARISKERALSIKRHKSLEQDVKGEPGLDSTAFWVPKLESPLEPTLFRFPTQPEGLLLAPVARRALTHADAAEISQPLRAQTFDGTAAGNAESIGHDLTLNSYAMASSARMKLGSARVSSPSSLSVNSEGSVTSLDCSERSIARWPAKTPRSPRKERQLLHLLL